MILRAVLAMAYGAMWGAAPVIWITSYSSLKRQVREMNGRLEGK